MNIKTFRELLILVFVFSLAVCGGDCFGGSIWAKRSKTSKPVYSDDKANQVGDILTVIISEVHKVDSKIKSDLQKDTSRELLFDGNKNRVEGGSIIDKLIPNTPSLFLEMSSKNTLKGKADYKDERSIQDRITVVVEDIHPNGNLVVIGTLSRNLDGDMQVIQVSGIVRPRDILFDNTIRSDQVANFNLVTINKGVSHNYNKPGWLGAFLDKIWPF